MHTTGEKFRIKKKYTLIYRASSRKSPKGEGGAKIGFQKNFFCILCHLYCWSFKGVRFVKGGEILSRGWPSPLPPLNEALIYGHIKLLQVRKKNYITAKKN